MTSDEILKEMDVLEEQAKKLREEITTERVYLVAKPKIDELEKITNKMFELHGMHQATLLDNLFDELKEYFGL